MTAQDLAWMIEAERQEAGLTAHELCRRAGVTKMTLYNALNGKPVNFTTIEALAGALGLELVLARKEEDDDV